MNTNVASEIKNAKAALDQAIANARSVKASQIENQIRTLEGALRQANQEVNEIAIQKQQLELAKAQGLDIKFAVNYDALEAIAVAEAQKIKTECEAIEQDPAYQLYQEQNKLHAGYMDGSLVRGLTLFQLILKDTFNARKGASLPGDPKERRDALKEIFREVTRMRMQKMGYSMLAPFAEKKVDEIFNFVEGCIVLRSIDKEFEVGSQTPRTLKVWAIIREKRDAYNKARQQASTPNEESKSEPAVTEAEFNTADRWETKTYSSKTALLKAKGRAINNGHKVEADEAALILKIQIA